MIGKTIGNYRIVEKLGKGATGTLFKALDETLGREVALKLLHADVAQSDVMKRFQVEVKALANLNHPEIARIHDVQISADGVLLVTELVRGESLEALMKRVGPLPAENAALIAEQVLSALNHAHAVGVVHRDLKPSNIMLTELGGIKVLDFAMAPVEGASQMTAASFAIGTPAFMAPERILGNDVDARADVYSIGAVFYQLLTGKLPFSGESATDMVQRQLSEPLTPARAHRADLPAWCDEIIARAMAKSPVDRFQSVEEFRAALQAHRSAAEVVSTGSFSAVRPAVAAGDAPTIAMPAPVAAAPSPSRPMPVVDPNAATYLTAIPAEALAPDAGSASRPIPAADPNAPTFLTAIPADLRADVAPTLAQPTPEFGDQPTIAIQVTPPASPSPTATAVSPMATAASPMATAASPVTATGTTLVMERKQFAAAGLILGVLAVGVIVLAVVVMRRSSQAEPPATSVATAAPSPAPVAPTPPSPAPAVSTPPSAGGGGVPTPTAPPPPVEIVDPPIRTAPVDAAPGARATSRPAAPRPASAAPATSATPVEEAPAAANPNLAKISNTTPLRFESKAVVLDGDRRRERDATVLLADGALNVTFADGKGAYSLLVSNLTGITYSNSRQPLWQSPSGPAEAMRVEGGGPFRGRSSWLGFRTPESLMVLRIDDGLVGRVIAGLQERTGLTVARLAEPKE